MTVSNSIFGFSKAKGKIKADDDMHGRIGARNITFRRSFLLQSVQVLFDRPFSKFLRFSCAQKVREGHKMMVAENLDLHVFVSLIFRLVL